MFCLTNKYLINYMEKYYAYLDECGGYGFNDSVLEQERMFIVAAAIIKESDIEVVNSALSRDCRLILLV